MFYDKKASLYQGLFWCQDIDRAREPSSETRDQKGSGLDDASMTSIVDREAEKSGVHRFPVPTDDSGILMLLCGVYFLSHGI